MTFGRLLRHKRHARKISLRQLEPLVGFSRTTLSAVERGAPPPLTLVARVAQAFQLDHDELFRLAGLIPPDVLNAVRDDPALIALVRRHARADQ